MFVYIVDFGLDSVQELCGVGSIHLGMMELEGDYFPPSSRKTFIKSLRSPSRTPWVSEVS